MDKYETGLKLFFDAAKSLSPLNFTFFGNKWYDETIKFAGYSQSNFNLYVELSRVDSSNLFVFSQIEGLDVYFRNKNAKEFFCVDLVDNSSSSVAFNRMKRMHKPFFRRGFELALKDESFLSEKIALALNGVREELNEFDVEVLDFGEGIVFPVYNVSK